MYTYVCMWICVQLFAYKYYEKFNQDTKKSDILNLDWVVSESYSEIEIKIEINAVKE